MNERYYSEMIWPVMDSQSSDPRQGLFAVQLHEDAPERALSVHCNDGLWNVHLDGKPLGVGMKWREAFGWIFSRHIPHEYDQQSAPSLSPQLFGRKIGFDEYKRIVAKRNADEANGQDLSQPIDLMTVRIP